jgi:hypothetical protein
MKKIVVGILAILYMGVSSGVAMELHYCMGDKAGVELYGSSSDTCGKCGMSEKDSGCCHDEYKFYKIEDSHKSVYNNIDLTASSEALVNDHFMFNWQLPEDMAATTVNNHSPPGYSGPSLCILNCVFRI